MPLTRKKIIEEINRQTNIPAKESARILESLLEIIKTTLVSDGSVHYSGFGKFHVREKHERRGRNPNTGRAMMLDARRVVLFSCSRQLRDRINGAGKGEGAPLPQSKTSRKSTRRS